MDVKYFTVGLVSVSLGLGKLDNSALMQQWFQLVQQKNSLVRYESELIIL